MFSGFVVIQCQSFPLTSVFPLGAILDFFFIHLNLVFSSLASILNAVMQVLVVTYTKCLHAVKCPPYATSENNAL